MLPPYLTLLFICCLPLGLVVAQPQSSTDVLARAELDNNTLTIGDQVWLKLLVSAPPGTEVSEGRLRSSKDPADSNAGNLPPSLEVVAEKALNTIAEQPELLLEQRWQFQVFDTGYVFVPAIMVPYRLAGSNQTDTAYTDPLLLTVSGIPVSEDSELMPIKPILKEPRNWQDFWPAYLLLLLAIGGFATWRWLKYRRTDRHVPPPPPPKPAHVLALEALDELEREALWQKNEVKTYYSRLSHILRAYLENRFRIPALESTTRQITRALMVTGEFDPAQRDELSELLQLSDLVKFAKAEPSAELHQRGLERVRSFVNATVPADPILHPDPSEEA